MGKKFWHRLLDLVRIWWWALPGKAAAFLQKEVPVLSLEEQLDQISMNLPRFQGEGRYPFRILWQHGLMYASYQVVHWCHAGAPSLILVQREFLPFNHHRFFQTLKKEAEMRGFNFLVVELPFSDSSPSFRAVFKSGQKLQLMLVVAVQVIEELVELLRLRGSEKVVVGGIGASGWPVNMHHYFYNSADEYRPMLSGISPGQDIWFGASSSLLAEESYYSPAYKKTLDLEEERCCRRGRNVFPLLGEFDQIFPLDKIKGFFYPDNVTVLPKGYVSALFSVRILSAFLMKGFDKIPFTRRNCKSS